MNTVAPIGFDYAALDEQSRDAARAAADRIRMRLSHTTQHIVEIGRELISAKKSVGHGRFLEWITVEFGMSQSTADRFVQVAKQFGDKLPTMGNLSATALYALAAPSTPDEVREKVEERVSAGESVTLEEIKALKEQWAEERKKLKEQITDAKDKTKDAKATQTDFGQQIADLQRDLASLRDERDTLKYELSHRAIPSADLREVSSSLADVETIDSQVAALMNDWNRVSPKARAEFLRRIDKSEPMKGAA